MAKSRDGDENYVFGETIDKSLYEDEVIETVKRIKKAGKSIYDLEATKREMSAEKDKYVFITIYQGHASIVISDKELFDTLFFVPTFGQMIDGPSISIRSRSSTLHSMSETTPLQQYHVILDGGRQKYMLSRNMYYMPWFMKSRSFFVGETAMAYLYLQMLCLEVVPSKYRLVIDDCLEFAKRFAAQIAIRENGVRKTEVEVLYRTLKVSEDYTTAVIEKSSRNNPKSGLTAALSYFMSFKTERFLIVLLILVLTIMSIQFFRYPD